MESIPPEGSKNVSMHFGNEPKEKKTNYSFTSLVEGIMHI